MTTYWIPPTNETFENVAQIDVPVLTYFLSDPDDSKKRAEQQATNFNERMRVLSFYVEDCTVSRLWDNPWHVVRVTERYSNGSPYHFYSGWHYATCEEAIFVAQMANWFRHDELALDALLASRPFDQGRLSCNLNGKYAREYWISRLNTLERIHQLASASSQ